MQFQSFGISPGDMIVFQCCQESHNVCFFSGVIVTVVLLSKRLNFTFLWFNSLKNENVCRVPKLTTYYFSQLLPQETLYTALLNSQYPFHSVAQLLKAVLQFHRGCYLAENKYTGSVTKHEVHLKASSQEKKEFCPKYERQQRNKTELSCELEPKKQTERKYICIINIIHVNHWGKRTKPYYTFK